MTRSSVSNGAKIFWFWADRKHVIVKMDCWILPFLWIGLVHSVKKRLKHRTFSKKNFFVKIMKLSLDERLESCFTCVHDTSQLYWILAVKAGSVSVESWFRCSYQRGWFLSKLEKKSYSDTGWPERTETEGCGVESRLKHFFFIGWTNLVLCWFFPF